LDQLTKEEEDKIEKDWVDQFGEIIDIYRKEDKPGSITSITATSDGKYLYLDGRKKKIDLFFVDKNHAKITVDGKHNQIFEVPGIFYLFAANTEQDLRDVIKAKAIKEAEIVKYANFMNSLGLLSKKATSGKHNFLRIYISDKGKGKDKSSSSGAGFDTPLAKLERLEVLIAERENGNDSHQLKTEILKLLDNVHASKLITREQRGTIMKSLNIS
jgi:hypothetical protein